jgi:hypothetical protein
MGEYRTCVQRSSGCERQRGSANHPPTIGIDVNAKLARQGMRHKNKEPLFIMDGRMLSNAMCGGDVADNYKGAHYRCVPLQPSVCSLT